MSLTDLQLRLVDRSGMSLNRSLVVVYDLQLAPVVATLDDDGSAHLESPQSRATVTIETGGFDLIRTSARLAFWKHTLNLHQLAGESDDAVAAAVLADMRTHLAPQPMRTTRASVDAVIALLGHVVTVTSLEHERRSNWEMLGQQMAVETARWAGRDAPKVLMHYTRAVDDARLLANAIVSWHGLEGRQAVLETQGLRVTPFKLTISNGVTLPSAHERAAALRALNDWFTATGPDLPKATRTKIAKALAT